MFLSPARRRGQKRSWSKGGSMTWSSTLELTRRSYQVERRPEGGTRGRSLSWFVCLLLLLPIVDAAAARAQSRASAVAVIDLTQRPAEVRNRLLSVDPLRTLVWLKVDPAMPSSALLDALGALNEATRTETLVAGIGVESTKALSRTEIEALSAYAARSSFVSAKFLTVDAMDWDILFAAQAQNRRLITTVYGAGAIHQISRVPSLARSFTGAAVPLVHVFAQAQGPDEAGRTFWRTVADRLQYDRIGMAVLVLDSGDAAGSDWTHAVVEGSTAAPERLYWVGGTDLRQFKPATLTSKSLTAWSVQRDGARRQGYDRKNSPAGLYQAMGASEGAFDVLAAMIERIQQASRRGVYFLADAENNLHTFRFLADVAATTICRATGCVGPLSVEGDAPAQSNVLLGPGSAGPFALYAAKTQLDIARPAAAATTLFCYACGLDRPPSGRGTPFKIAEF